MTYCNRSVAAAKRRGGFAIWLAAAVVALGPALAWGQDELMFTPRIDPRGMVADQLVNVAALHLASASAPLPDQLVRAQIVYDIILQLAPDNPEYWRLQLELARQAGDHPRQVEALRRYVRLVPADDAAQLALVMAAIEEHQTLAERAEAVERVFASASAERFSAPLRSRLASYLAQAATEAGQDRRAGEFLAKALTLDATNRQAAQLAYDAVKARTRAGQRSLLAEAAAVMQLLRAAPFDPAVRLEFARLLLGHGLYAQAAVQFQVADRIEPLTFNPPALYDWCLSLIATRQFDRAIELLSGHEEYLTAVAQQRAYAQAQAQGPNTPVAAVPVQELPLDLQLLRLVIFERTGYSAKTQGTYGRIVRQLESRQADGDDQAVAERVWLAALVNLEGHQRDAELAKLAERGGADDLATRIRGWHALHDGHHRQARELLAPLAERDAFAAYGVGLATPATNTNARAEALANASALGHGSLAGALAAAELHALERKPPLPPHAQQVVRMIEQWPATLRDPNFEVTPPVQFNLALATRRFGYLDPLRGTLTVRNVGDAPLAIGDRTRLPHNAFLVPSYQRVGQIHTIDVAPIIIDMRRRLTLPPGETISVPINLDRSALGELLARYAGERIAFSITAMLDPIPQPQGRPFPSFIGQTDVERLLERQSYPPTIANIEQWLGDLTGPDPVERQRSLARLCIMAAGMLNQEDNPEVLALGQRIAEAVNEAFPALPPHEQAWTCWFLFGDDKSRAAFAAAHQAAALTREPIVSVVYLTRFTQGPDSPLVEAALQSENPVIRTFADNLKVGLVRMREEVQEAQRRAREQQQQR